MSGKTPKIFMDLPSALGRSWNIIPPYPACPKFRDLEDKHAEALLFSMSQ